MENRIFELLEERNVTQKELAQRIGVSTGNISDWKSGRAKPSFDALNRIADYFNVSIDYLLCRTDIENMDELITIAHTGVIRWMKDRAFSPDEQAELRTHFYELLSRYQKMVKELFGYACSDSRKNLLNSGASLADLSNATCENIQHELHELIRWIAVFPVTFNQVARPNETHDMELTKSIDRMLGLVSTDEASDHALTEDEAELLQIWAMLDKDGRRVVLGTATSQKQRVRDGIY